jgi:hypothetical protein
MRELAYGECSKHKGQNMINCSQCEIEKAPYISDDFQIGPDGAYEHIEYSIPIYENNIKTEFSIDGIVGDEKYLQLMELNLIKNYQGNKGLPIRINVGIQNSTPNEYTFDNSCNLCFGVGECHIGGSFGGSVQTIICDCKKYPKVN